MHLEIETDEGPKAIVADYYTPTCCGVLCGLLVGRKDWERSGFCRLFGTRLGLFDNTLGNNDLRHPDCINEFGPHKANEVVSDEVRIFREGTAMVIRKKLVHHLYEKPRSDK